MCCVLFWDFPPPSLWLVCVTLYGRKALCISHGVFSIHGWQPDMFLCAWIVTPWWKMSYCVQRCFPFPHRPHAKINIWYESQGTEASWIVQKVLSPFSCCCCYFFNIIFLMGWVTVYSRIKGWRRYFGISLSTSVFLLWNLGNFFWCLLWIFCLSAHLGFIFPPCRPPPLPSFHKWRRGEIVCMCVWCPAKQRN